MQDPNNLPPATQSGDELENDIVSGLVKALFTARNKVMDGDASITAAYGLTWTQFVSLGALVKEGNGDPMTPTQLYDFAGVSSGGVTKLLRGLEAKGLVVRQKSQKDGRSKLVVLTQSGRSCFQKIGRDLMAHNTATFSEKLTRQECEDLIKLLGRISGP